MGASVKIMLSYDYCHFEICKSTDENFSDKQINEIRKDVQRLADEAVRQYIIAKQKARLREGIEYKIRDFKEECERILKKPEGERTVNDIAILKQYQDEQWEEKFRTEYAYDYEDDDETYNF